MCIRDRYRKLNRISTGRLETAVPVTPETERKIIDLIASETNGKVELKTSVKPELDVYKRQAPNRSTMR